MYYDWSDEKLSLGIEVVDEQHKKFFELTNKFAESFKDRDEIEQSLEAIDFLEDYAKTHFSTEEFYMRKYQYPELIPHIKIHQNFCKSVEELKKRYRQTGLNREAAIEIREFLLGWISRHIVNMDSKYAELLRSKIKPED